MSVILQKPLTPFSLFINLVQGKGYPDGEWSKVKFRLKYLLRTIIYPRITFSLLNKLLNDPAVRNGFRHQSMMPAKIHRPYLIANAGLKERYQFLCDHYHFAAVCATTPYYDLLLGNGGRELVSFRGKNDKAYLVRYNKSSFCREGEITLMLSQDGISLASLTFSVIYNQSLPVLVIGGLQGNASASNETMKQATKACYGLFPKRVLLECVRSLALATGIAHIWGVSDSGHVFRNVRYRKTKRAVFVASYDDFWTLVGGTSISSSLFSLPVISERKTLEAIPSHKRSAYRQRFCLLDMINEKIAGTSP